MDIELCYPDLMDMELWIPDGLVRHDEVRHEHGLRHL